MAENEKAPLGLTPAEYVVKVVKTKNNNNKTNKIKNNQSKKNEKVVEHLKNLFAMVRNYMIEEPNLRS